MSDDSEGIDEDPIHNPLAPIRNPPALLEPEGRSTSDLIVPGLIGVAGLAILYFAYNKKKKKVVKPSESKPKTTTDSVTFSKLYVEYSVDPGWITNVLEPFLMQQHEEGVLVTNSTYSGSALNIDTSPLWKAEIAASRKSVINAFCETHKAITHDGALTFSAINKANAKQPGVVKFKAWLDAQVKAFQEEY